MSGSRSETVAATVCGRCAAMEPTEGCGVLDRDLGAGLLAHEPILPRRERYSGASEPGKIAEEAEAPGPGQGRLERRFPGLSRCGGGRARLAASPEGRKPV